ncbi:MAG: orotidine-5'-phosphate decarboxylase [Candidatus Marinimicrobia bacterium]|nr:orotidine-5'-phosphate decarboxylase [Candidatus Neomarinimicrobiota bacterium]MBL7023725.1 orotidine-5'-phosphate decarboxylase [Candidatus Neomarinimicrobiota bacterium]MBL7109506.1 orotidine-5'-phosphate decarboxylase [Candidatus Neomarinimicrobiota bacterium]
MENSFNNKLKNICNRKNSRLCIGLDIDPEKLPKTSDKSLQGLESFAKDVIDATIDFCPVYKPNMAFYERFGSQGYALVERLVDHIAGRSITIADAKRGDIGNTTKQYAKAVFNTIGFDAITVAPYMGRDSIIPFIEDETKGAFVLCLTSNKSAEDLQYKTSNGTTIYEDVANLVLELNENDNLGLVVGATKTEQMQSLREQTANLSWLIPGIGAQGGSLEESISIGNQNGVGIINVSRGILYAGDGSLNAIVESAQNYTKQIREVL